MSSDVTMTYVLVHYKLGIHDAGPRVGHYLFISIPQSEQALRLTICRATVLNDTHEIRVLLPEMFEFPLILLTFVLL